MPLEDIEVKFKDSPLSTAMDLYYENLLEHIPIHANEKLCLVSSLVTLPFNADKKAVQYNNYLVRLLADRVIDFGSPKKLPEQVQLGSLDSSEQFSSRYRDYAQAILDKHIPDLSTDDIEKYSYHKNAHRTLRKEYQSELKAILDGWREYRTINHPSKTDKELVLEKATYFNQQAPALDELDSTSQLMKSHRLIMGALLREGDPAAKLASSVLNALEDSKQYLPVDAEDAIKYEMDGVWLGTRTNTLNDPAYLDRRVVYRNTFDYQVLLRKGARDLVMSSEMNSNDSHSTSWSASASIRYGWFFKAKVSASESTATTKSVQDINKVEIKFQHLYETLVGRGQWYNKDVFNSDITGAGDAEMETASRLKYAVKSIIFARGTKVLLHFEDGEQATHFRKFSTSGSASFLGGLIPFGSGSYNSLKKGDDSSHAITTVSFEDDDDVVRMIGYRLEQVHDYVSDTKLSANGGLHILSPQQMKSMFGSQYSENGFVIDDSLM